jgi:hypothetical protein
MGSGRTPISLILIAQLALAPLAQASSSVVISKSASSGASRVVRTPRLAPELVALQAEGNRIAQQLFHTLFEARNLNTLTAGRVSQARLRERLASIEQAFEAWRGKLEAATFAHAKTLSLGAGGVVSFYFEQAIKLVQLQALLRPETPARFESFDFSIPYRLLEELSGFREAEASKLVSQILASPDSPIALDPASVRSNGELAPGHPVKLQLGRSFAERLVAVARGGMGDEKSFVTLFKFLVASSLLDQWDEIDALRKTPAARVPAFPASLASELGTMGFPAASREQSRWQSEEPDRRLALFAGFSRWWFENDAKALKPELATITHPELARLDETMARATEGGIDLSTEGFLDGYLAIVFPAYEPSPEALALRAGLLKGLRQAESLYVKLALKNLFEAYPLPMAGMGASQLGLALRRILSEAKFLAILPVLRLIPIPKGKDAAVSAYLDRQVAEYAPRIPERVISGWIADAESKVAPADERRETRTKRFTQLIEDVKALRREKDALEAEEVDFAKLKDATRRSAEYQALPGTAKADLDLVLKPESWSLSIRAYRMLASMLDEREARARAAGNAAQADQWKTERAALKPIALKLGFYESKGTPPQKLFVRDLGSEERQAYLQERTLSLLNQPLLTATVQGKPLHEWVSANPTVAAAEPYIDQVLETIERGIHENLEKLGRARGIRDLLPLAARSPLLKMQIARAFPGLEEQMDAAVESHLKAVSARGRSASFNEEANRPMMIAMALFAMKYVLRFGLGKTRILTQAVGLAEAGFTRASQGYLLATLVLVGVVPRLEYLDSNEAERDDREGQEWFYSSAGSSSFIDYISLMESSEAASQAVSKFRTSLGMAGILATLPIFGMAFGPEIRRAADGLRARRFARLGFAPADIEMAYEAAAGRQALLGAETGKIGFTWDSARIWARARERIEEIRASELFNEGRRAKELAIERDAARLADFAEKHRKVAERMLRDFSPRFRELGIRRGQETLNLWKLTEARQALEARYRSFEITREQLERGYKAYDEIVGAAQDVASGVFTPLRSLFFARRGGEGRLLGEHEMLRERLYREIYGFTEEGRFTFQFTPLTGPSPSASYGLVEPAPVKDYYGALEIEPTASGQEIKSAYRKLARKYHPDVNPGDTAAEDKFKEIGEAFSVLGDPGKRSNYDVLWAKERAER